MSTPKRQHFIPILHLKHFVGRSPEGQVWTYDAATGESYSTIPDNTAVESHFYSIEGTDGVMDTRIETYLSEVESAAAPIYQGLLKGGIPPKDSRGRGDFALFLALMHVRTPAMRKMAAEVAGRQLQIMAYAYGRNEKAFEDLNRRAERDGLRPLNDKEKKRLRQDFLDPSGYMMQIAKERTLPILGAADNLAPVLFEMTWTVVEAQHGFFITTDNPLIRRVDPKTRHPVYGDHGFRNKTAEVLFPLTPKRLLLLSWSDAVPASGVFQREHVGEVNRSLAAQSDRYLYAHIEHKRIMDLAKEFKDSRPSLATQGFGPKTFAKIQVSRRRGK